MSYSGWLRDAYAQADRDDAYAAEQRALPSSEPVAEALQRPAGDDSSRAMFVARLENERDRNGRPQMSIDDVLALLNDCDMLAASEAYQSEFRKSSSPNGETK